MGTTPPTEHRAVLSVDGELSCFATRERRVRFRTSPRLRSYSAVLQWDDGYLVVLACYEGQEEPVEEYIDLVPILENLYLDPEDILTPIKEVAVL